MGYVRKSKPLKLSFEDEFEGLEVKMKPLSVIDFLDVARQASDKNNDTDFDSLLKTFQKYLVSWNLEDENGKAVPTTLKAVQGLDFEFSLALISAWLEAAGGVGRPLGKSSASGDNSLEASIPMETS